MKLSRVSVLCSQPFCSVIFWNFNCQWTYRKKTIPTPKMYQQCTFLCKWHFPLPVHQRTHSVVSSEIHSEHKNPWEQSASTAWSKTRFIPAVGQDKHAFFFFQGNYIWLVYCCTITHRAEEGKEEPLTKEKKALSCKFLHFLQISPWENVIAFMWESQGRGWWDAELRPSDFFFFSELDVAWVFILQPSL